MDKLQSYKLKKFINELKRIRGRHTELVSVYIPAGYDLNKIINHIAQEQGTASNIKDKNTRNNVIDSLEKMIRHLRLFKKTPENGLAVFSGNVAAQEGKTDLKIWSIEPPIPLNFRLYRCDQTFVLDELEKMLDVNEVYGLIVMDNRDGAVGLLKGTSITVIKELTSGVPGKTRAGGQCEVFGTLVQLASGEILKIEDIHNPHAVKSVDINNLSLANSNVIDKMFVNKNKVYRITTYYPQLINESSADHLFYVITPNGIIEKAAEELRKGDYLLTPEKIEIKGSSQLLNNNYYNFYRIKSSGLNYLKNKRIKQGLSQKKLQKLIGIHQAHISSIEKGKRNFRPDKLKILCSKYGIDYAWFLKEYTKPAFYKHVEVKLPSVLNQDLALFLGYFMGDGNFEEDRITFSEQNKQVALYYKDKFNKFFNLNGKCRFRKKKNYYQIRFTSRPLVRFIKEEFSEIKSKKSPQMPVKLLKSDNKVVAKFLRGLFDAEGYVSSGKVGIGTINKTLIQQIQLLLLRFSIISSLFEWDNRSNPYSKKPIFKLRISDKESLKNFENLIGFTSKIKTKKLNDLIKNKTYRTSIRQILPIGLKIKEFLKDYNYKLESFKASGFLNNKRMISKKVFMNNILKNIKNKNLYSKLNKIYNSQLIPIKINNIEIINMPTKMVDIEVKNQNFIANGILVHNSSQRFARLREEAKHDFYKRISEVVNKEFLGMKDLKGILVGGPGMTKETFVNGNYLNNELKKKVIAIKDLSYTGEYGLNELVEKSKDKLVEEEITKEKEIVNELLTMLATNIEKVAYGKEDVRKALEMGAVDKLLISEVFDAVEEFEILAEKYGTKVFIVSTETREGVQLRDLGGIAAILRYAIG